MSWVRKAREYVWRRWSEVVRGGSHASSFPARCGVQYGRALLEEKQNGEGKREEVSDRRHRRGLNVQ
jgi:hypothetical protein